MCPQRQHLSLILSVLLSLWMDLTSGEINIQPIPQYPVIGGSVTLAVTGVTGNIVGVSWFKGPNTSTKYQILAYITGDTSPLIKGRLYFSRAAPFPNGSLLISDLRITDSGHYTVKIQTDKLADVSVTLTVYERVSKPKVRTNTYLPKENDPLTLICHSANAERIRWSRDNAGLPPGHVLSTDNRTVTFSKVKRKDSGDYRCEAENSLSQSLSDPYTVAVCYGPENTQITVTVYAGSVFSIACSADSVPPPVYQWRFNDIAIEQITLRSDHVSPEDQGTYTCMVNNSVTQHSAAASMFLYVNTSTEISSAANPGTIVGATFGVILGVVLMITAGVVLYRIHVSKRQKVSETSGDGPDQSPVYENFLDKEKRHQQKDRTSLRSMKPAEQGEGLTVPIRGNIYKAENILRQEPTM